MADRVELVADVSRLGGDLAGLRALLDGPLAGLFGGVHLLSVPLPPDMADAETDARAALDALVRDYDIIVDLPVNDVPAASAPFLDWLEHGGASAFDGMFLTLGSVFPAGVAESDLALLHLPGPGVPFSVYAGADGAARVVWTTFGPGRIDIDVAHPQSRARLLRALDDVAASGVRRVRIADVGYARKAAGTSSYWLPHTVEFLAEITGWCRERGLRVAVDAPDDPALRRQVAALVDDVPDAEPARLVMQALRTGAGESMADWLRGRPADANDVLAAVRPTDALPPGDDRVLLAHALLLWSPGRPRVSSAALIAGTDAPPGATPDARDVPSPPISRAEVETALKRPGPAALLRLLRFRAEHPAFAGELAVRAAGADLLASWTAGADIAELDADLETGEAAVRFTRAGRRVSAPLDRLP